MLRRGYGRVVNVASTAGLTGYAYVTAYCAAKHGVVGLTRALALETARKNITVNAVCPGYTETDIVRDAVVNIVAKTGKTEDEARTALTSRAVDPRVSRARAAAGASIGHRGGRRDRGEKRGERQPGHDRRRHGQRRARQQRVPPTAGRRRGRRLRPSPRRSRPHVHPP